MKNLKVLSNKEVSDLYLIIRSFMNELEEFNRTSSSSPVELTSFILASCDEAKGGLQKEMDNRV